MPFRDKTGPEGKGPKTGRGLGNCDENDFPSVRPIPTRLGFGQGMGRGRGRGMGRRFLMRQRVVDENKDE